MKNILNIALLVAMGLFLNSCYYDAFPEEIIEPPVVIEDVSYTTDIVPLWAKCLGCHTSTNTLNLKDNSYSNILKGFVVPGDAEGSRLYNYLPGNGHHEVGLSLEANDISLIKAWIDQGALNN